MQTLQVNVPELRAQMGRANIKATDLAIRAGVHRNTINNILRRRGGDLESVGRITSALNAVLREEGFAEIGPFGLLEQADVVMA